MSGTSSRVIRFPVTIEEDETESNVVNAWETYGGAAGLTIFSPDALLETVNIEVHHKDTATNDDTGWVPWMDGDPLTAQEVPPAGTAQPFVTLVTVNAIRLVATGAVAADRTFWFTWQATH